MNKTDQLLEAIGDIDDSFVMEASRRRPKVLQGHWGLVASAACFCLMIASVVFLRGVGLLSPATQPTEPITTTPPTTQVIETTKDTEPPGQTIPHNTLPTPELQMYNDLFSDPYSWYNAALRCEYASPEDISLLMLFYSGFEGESQKPTDEEWAQLKDVEGFNENYDLLRLPVNKMNAILTELFGITLSDVKPEGFEGLTYLESTDCWYHMTTSIRYADFTAQNVEPTGNGTKVYYDGGYKGNMVVTVTPNGADGYRILSNLPMDDEEQARIDTITKLFNEDNSWYNLALTSTYQSPKEVGLLYFFYNGMEGMLDEATQEEEAQLKEISNRDGSHTLYRMPSPKMDEILAEYFGVTLADMDSKAFAGMEYLESTDCWYYYGGGTISVKNISVLSVTQSSDGMLQVNFTVGNSQQTHVMNLEPNGDGYRIMMHIALE